jgi:protein ImuB
MAWPLACLSKSSPVPECLLVGAGVFAACSLARRRLAHGDQHGAASLGRQRGLAGAAGQCFCPGLSDRSVRPAGVRGRRCGWQPLCGQGSTAWQALARLRLQQGRPGGCVPVCSMPEPSLHADALPLWTLSALEQHSAVLLRLGCRCWGDVRALPRGAVAPHWSQGLACARRGLWSAAPAA